MNSAVFYNRLLALECILQECKQSIQLDMFASSREEYTELEFHLSCKLDWVIVSCSAKVISGFTSGIIVVFPDIARIPKWPQLLVWKKSNIRQLSQTVPLLTFIHISSIFRSKFFSRFFYAANEFISKIVPGIDQSGGIPSLINYNSPDSSILLLLSGGVDPTSDIEELAARDKIELTQIALEDKNYSVIEVIKESMTSASWLLIEIFIWEQNGWIQSNLYSKK